MAIAAHQTLKTLYTVTHLARVYSEIKDLLKRGLKSYSSLKEQAVKGMVKSC